MTLSDEKVIQMPPISLRRIIQIGQAVLYEQIGKILREGKK